MPDNDVLIAKIGIIKRCLLRIKNTTGLNPDNLEDFNVQDIYVLNLQRAIQAAVDISNHIIAEENLGLPDSLKQSFDLLYENKIISYEICKKMRNMVAFRNICVHEYKELDINILKSILTNNLSDIEDYYKKIAEKYLSNTE